MHWLFKTRVVFNTIYIWNKVTHSTHSILGAPLGEHKAPTNFFHSDRSWASHRLSFHVFPAVFISSSMVLRQVPSGLPRCLFPGGAHAGLSSCEGHGQATSTVFFSPPERCCSSLCASRSPHCTPFLATWLSIFSVSISLRSPEVCSPTSCWFSTSLRRREELNVRWTGRFWAWFWYWELWTSKCCSVSWTPELREQFW